MKKKILVNCVSRIFHLNQEWIKDFLKNGEDLQIKEIENMHEQDEVLDNRENMVQNPQHDVIQGQFQVMIIKELMKMKQQALPLVKKNIQFMSVGNIIVGSVIRKQQNTTI